MIAGLSTFTFWTGEDEAWVNPLRKLGQAVAAKEIRQDRVDAFLKYARACAASRNKILAADTTASLLRAPLKGTDVDFKGSDFYSYRYFAAEGFLPGYNFPRLPLSAYLPGSRRRRAKTEDDFLSRPRFLAISEFGPRSIIYHEGSRYVVNQVIMPVAGGDRAGDPSARGAVQPMRLPTPAPR